MGNLISNLSGKWSTDNTKSILRAVFFSVLGVVLYQLQQVPFEALADYGQFAVPFNTIAVLIGRELFRGDR